MAEVSRVMSAAPDRVFATLADGWQYAGWVVGSVKVRAVEGTWPAVGSRIHHAVGAWPLTLKDETEVELSQPGVRLVLLARGRPFGEARVDIRLEDRAAGTLVTMIETPVSGPGKWLNNPALEALLRARNVEALARLAALVEAPTRPA
jgi:Polyketide cyclase / dehydrase and lipid transport